MYVNPLTVKSLIIIVVGLAGFSKLRNVGGFKTDGIIKILFSEYEWQTPFRKIVLFIYISYEAFIQQQCWLCDHPKFNIQLCDGFKTYRYT